MRRLPLPDYCQPGAIRRVNSVNELLELTGKAVRASGIAERRGPPPGKPFQNEPLHERPVEGSHGWIRENWQLVRGLIRHEARLVGLPFEQVKPAALEAAEKQAEKHLDGPRRSGFLDIVWDTSHASSHAIQQIKESQPDASELHLPISPSQRRMLGATLRLHKSGGLDEQQAWIMALRVAHRLSFEDVGKTLEASNHTVRHHYSRALAQIGLHPQGIKTAQG